MMLSSVWWTTKEEGKTAGWMNCFRLWPKQSSFTAKHSARVIIDANSRLREGANRFTQPENDAASSGRPQATVSSHYSLYLRSLAWLTLFPFSLLGFVLKGLRLFFLHLHLPCSFWWGYLESMMCFIFKPVLLLSFSSTFCVVFLVPPPFTEAI